jgi:hypothetical protein
MARIGVTFKKQGIGKMVFYWTVMIVLTAGIGIVLGLIAVIAGYFTDRSPAEVDDEGCTTVRGKRHRWADLVQLQPTTITRRGVPTGWFMRFRFKTGEMVLQPSRIENARAVSAQIESRIGKSLGAPAYAA